MNYEECRLKIQDAARYGSILGLDSITETMKRLGNPQDAYPVVHAAGTNGKGSVLTYLYYVLTRAGYRVGRYLSPAVFDSREQFSISGADISPQEYALCAEKVIRVCCDMEKDGLPHPTSFEMETALAFEFFAEKHCDIVLLETGLGGDLDATNVVKRTILAVFTSISMDHMLVLGSSLTDIAKHKAGILKDGCRCISVRQPAPVMEVLKEACRSFPASQIPFYLSDERKAEILEEGWSLSRFRCPSGGRAAYQIGLAGKCQIQNAVLALDALDLLENMGFPVGKEARLWGLSHAFLPGRLQILGQRPLFLLDGAHNPDAARKLAMSLKAYPSGKNIFILGVFQDKDIRGICEETAFLADKIFTIQTPDSQRAMPAARLAVIVRDFHENVESCLTIREAIEKAMREASPEDTIAAFGSLAFHKRLREEYERFIGFSK